MKLLLFLIIIVAAFMIGELIEKYDKKQRFNRFISAVFGCKLNNKK
jgi:hypothetical protein